MSNEMKAKLALALLAVVAFFAVLGWAGDVDYTDQIILSMSQEQYDSIRDHLKAKTGSTPSEREIARYYLSLQE